MKKIAVLLALMLVSIEGVAQQYIIQDEVNGFSRSISTKSYPVVVDNTLYAIAFNYLKRLTDEVYYIMVACMGQPTAWEVKEKEIGAFKMADGANIYLESIMKSNCEASGAKYNIVASYEIPADKVYNMLGLISRITINKREPNSERDSSIEIPIPYSASDPLMSAYLELLTMTGK